MHESYKPLMRAAVEKVVLLRKELLKVEEEASRLWTASNGSSPFVAGEYIVTMPGLHIEPILVY